MARALTPYEQRIEDKVRQRLQRSEWNNSIPVIRERILRILGAAEGRRLKRSRLTQKLSNLGCTRDERRIEALRQFETAGVIRPGDFSGARGKCPAGRNLGARKTTTLICPHLLRPQCASHLLGYYKYNNIRQQKNIIISYT
jgi:hypothetical protein